MGFGEGNLLLKSLYQRMIEHGFIKISSDNNLNVKVGDVFTFECSTTYSYFKEKLLDGGIKIESGIDSTGFISIYEYNQIIRDIKNKVLYKNSKDEYFVITDYKNNNTINFQKYCPELNCMIKSHSSNITINNFLNEHVRTDLTIKDYKLNEELQNEWYMNYNLVEYYKNRYNELLEAMNDSKLLINRPDNRDVPRRVFTIEITKDVMKDIDNYLNELREKLKKY